MSGWDRLGEWLGTLVVASLAWVSGVAGAELFLGTPAEGAPADEARVLVWGWAQEVDLPPIEQVGEGEGEDVETLDEAAPPAQDEPPGDDPEPLDTTAVPVAPEEDTELLDQGAPPAAVPGTDVAAPPAETISVAPTTETVPSGAASAPATPLGPVLPPGFGSGHVHVVTGRSSFPPGLEGCHVGAVTGRAYVGIDCDEGGSVAGHAPSFQDFPFVLDDFPFGDGSLFRTETAADVGDDGVENIAMARPDIAGVFDDEAEAPVVEITGSSSVQFTQRAREREPRVRVSDGERQRAKEPSKRKKRDASAASSRGDSRGGESAKADREDEPAGAESNAKKSGEKDKKTEKQRAEGKGKKNRASGKRRS